MISVIVPTLKSPSSLVKLVNSLAAQNYPVENLEILLVLNPPQKKIPQWMGPLSEQVRWLVAPQKGVNHARNTGIRCARGEWLLFIDDDCELTDLNYLKKLENIQKQNPLASSIGGPYQLKKKSSFWSRVYHFNMNLWLQEQRIGSEKSRLLLGGNACYRRKVFEAGLRFTPAITYGGSETPLNWQVLEQYGPAVFSEELAVVHLSQMGLMDFLRKAYLQGKGFAWQSKLFPQRLQKQTNALHDAPQNLRWALKLYSFFFVVGFRSGLHERRWPLRSFLEESLVRIKHLFHKKALQ